MRANAIHLDESQMWDIVKYVVEHKGVVQDGAGDFLQFRVSKKLLAEEVSKNLGIKINSYQIEKSVLWHAKICNLFGNKMISPPAQESVEEDRLKIENMKLQRENEHMNLINEQNRVLINQLNLTLNNYRDVFNQINRLASVTVQKGKLGAV